MGSELCRRGSADLQHRRVASFGKDCSLGCFCKTKTIWLANDHHFKQLHTTVADSKLCLHAGKGPLSAYLPAQAVTRLRGAAATAHSNDKLYLEAWPEGESAELWEADDTLLPGLAFAPMPLNLASSCTSQEHFSCRPADIRINTPDFLRLKRYRLSVMGQQPAP